MIRTIAFLIIGFGFVGNAAAATRTALVIGNGSYLHSANLPNPSRDAKAIGESLRAVGFDVTVRENLDLSSLVDTLERFQSKAARADDAIIYFAGHGVESGGENYMLPVDARLATESRLRYEAVPLTHMMDSVAGAKRLQLVILDACRNNPLANTMKRSNGSRSTFRGLARPAERSNALVAYATKASSVAADGTGRNSPYAQALIDAFAEPGLEIGLLFRKVRDRVLALTDGVQEPWLYGTLGSQLLYLRPPDQSAPKPGIDNPEFLAFQAAQRVGSESAWDSFLKSYPTSAYVATAQIELAALSSPSAVPQPQHKSQPKPEPERQPSQNVPFQPSAWPPPPTLAGYQSGDTFKDCDGCPEMVVLPAGQFNMGSDDGDQNERPVHTVKIDYEFAVSKYEITFNQWDACVSAGGCDGNQLFDKGWGRGNRPVIYVYWNEARSYARWLSEKTGKRYRLLSEAEWEYAARAGTTTDYYWGDKASPKYANYDSKGWLAHGDGYEFTAPVGSFPANSFGLYDMLGNVSEWTEDCWNESYSGAPANGSAWTDGDCGPRVIRGGAWTYYPRVLRAARRQGYGGGGYSEGRAETVGFRLARTD